jgi:hypothetical protein
MSTLWAGSLYGAKTGRGLVELSEVGEDDVVRWRRQCTPEEARDHALRILEAASAAELDAVVVRWLMAAPFNMNAESAALVLLDFRKHRDAERAG